MENETKLLTGTENLPGTIPSKRAIRLKSIFDINRLLARTVNQLIRGQIEETKAGKIGYLCNVMLKSFELTELERRIGELEKRNNGER